MGGERERMMREERINNIYQGLPGTYHEEGGAMGDRFYARVFTTKN